MLLPRNIKRMSQNGFTKIELVFVLLCSLILLGLFVPSCQRSYSPARRTQCANNVRNLGLANIQYEMRNGHFPPYLHSFGQHDPAISRDPSIADLETPAHAKVGTWAVALLADLDNQPVYEFWTIDEYALLTIDPENPTQVRYDAKKVPNMEIFQCSNDKFYDDEPFGKNSYVSNNGTFAATFPANLGEVNSESSANGIFNFHGDDPDAIDSDKRWPPTNAIGPKTSMNDIVDGKTHTALISENVQAAAWFQVVRHPKTLTSSDVYQQINPRDVEAYHGFLWHYVADPRKPGIPGPSDEMRINGGDITDEKLTDAPNIQVRARPSSVHAGGVNMAFADGGVRYISESIDYRVYQALMTPHDAKSDVPDPSFVLEDQDL
ncbi:MAG: DUF1559 domain-containing protein [Pirellulaceae bacterium]